MYDWRRDKLVPGREKPFSMNVEGPFYVADFCIICFSPPEAAPANIFEHYNPDGQPGCSHSSCYVGKQPEDDQELEQMIEAMDTSCVGAIRYRGSDPEVLRRICARGLQAQCDALFDAAGQLKEPLFQSIL